jgi:cytoskeletal protein CcmA (bactofilin family)
MAEATQSMTVIGPDTHIKGELSFDTTARILGKVEGKVTSKGELQIGEGAICKAALEAGRIVIDGFVEGNITARERIQLNAKARVMGDLLANTLVVADGASFIGHCRVGAEAGRSAAAEPARSRTATTPSRNGATPAAPENLAAAFAGLEAKLAGIGKARAETAAD